MNRILKRTNIKSLQGGFTIVEILVAVAISGVVMAGIYSAYYSQQRSYETQEKVVAIQQNLRAAMYFMEREIRMAGLDPTKSGNFDIQTATSTTMRFLEDTSDASGTGDPDGTPQDVEDITYFVSTSDMTLQRKIGDDSIIIIAENIEALDFVYLDADGSVIADPTTDIDDIRSVQVAIVARSDKTDPKYTNTQTFKNLQGTDITTVGGDSYPLNDNYRREILTAQVKCRNIGLE